MRDADSRLSISASKVRALVRPPTKYESWRAAPRACPQSVGAFVRVGPLVFPQPTRATPFSDPDIGEKAWPGKLGQKNLARKTWPEKFGKSAKRRSKAAAPFFRARGVRSALAARRRTENATNIMSLRLRLATGVRLAKKGGIFEGRNGLNVANANANAKAKKTRATGQGRQVMAIFKTANFDERRNAAEAAKAARLEKFRALSAQINEGAAERQAARQAIVAAREVRAAERETARLAAEARAAESEAARETALKAEQAERDANAAEQAARDAAEQAERKAARDARYAARKARN
jgi:hypothetical protein